MRADLEKDQANVIKCAPPYLFSAIWTVVVAWMADRTKLRMPYMVLNAVITLVGLLLTAYDKVVPNISLPYGAALLTCITEQWGQIFWNLPRRFWLQRKPPNHHCFSEQQCSIRQSSIRGKWGAVCLCCYWRYLCKLHVHAEGGTVIPYWSMVCRGESPRLGG
jgi:hypothetical protein